MSGLYVAEMSILGVVRGAEDCYNPRTGKLGR